MSYYSSDPDFPGRPIRRSRTGQQRPSHTNSFGHRATVPRMWSQDSNSRNMVPPNHQAPHYLPRVVDERHRRPSRRSRVTIEPYDRENDSDSGTDSDRGERRRRRISIVEINTELEDDRANDTPTSTIYSFTLSHISHTTSTQERSASGAEEPSEKEDHGVINSAGAGGGIGPLQSYIFESNYSGNNLLGGSHGAKLTAVVRSHLDHAPLFRWRHCTRNFMDFDEFSTEAIGCPGLTAVEKRGIHDLLSRVQRRHVKSLQTSAGRTVRHMEPTSIQQPLPQDGPAKTASFARRMVTWVCLPYFTLEKYSGLQGAPNNRSAFPIETLLQSKFSRTARERDMRQAICQMNETPDGLCFHVAQIWCLVVDNSFLFTYGRMTEETLRGDIIDMSVKPVQEISKTHRRSFITVSFKTSVMWSIPVEECHTWLDFMSHFREFWPQRLLFFHQKRPVKSDCWPRISNMARHVSRIMLEMQIGASVKPPPVGILLLKQENATEPSLGPAGSEAASGPSHVTPGTSTDDHRVAPVTMSIFSCLMGVSRPEYGSVDQDALDEYMREVEDFLLSNTSLSDRRAYKDCPEASRDEIYDYLENEGAEIVNLESQDRERQHAYETQIDIFNAANKAFAFFFPLDVDVPTTKKFWGAVKSIILGVNGGAATIQPMQGVIASHSIRSIRLELRGLCVGIGAFNEIFMLSGRSEQARITVPKEIVEGWIHLLLGLMNLPTDFDRSSQLIDNAKSLIHGGMTDVVHGLSEKPLLDSSVVLPLELLSLMSLRMVQDTTVGMPNITECYSLSLDEMESGIASKALDRSREYRIGLLMEEITAVRRVVDAQQKIFKTLLSSSDHTTNRDRSVEVDAMPTRFSSRQTYQRERSSRPRDPFASYKDDIPSMPIIVTDMSIDFRLSSVDAGGYRILFLNECLQFLAGRDNDLAGFWDCAAFLEKKFSHNQNQNKIDTTKDRHDNAIYAFTIVTIIFLPLSFVASVFGMNTNDVRNMDLDQWAYWATAVPVTAVIIFLGLLWTGELGNIMRWIQSLGQSHSGYRTLPDDVAREEYIYLSPYSRDEGRRR